MKPFALPGTLVLAFGIAAAPVAFAADLKDDELGAAIDYLTAAAK